jgi:uronate dehydrogenase
MVVTCIRIGNVAVPLDVRAVDLDLPEDVQLIRIVGASRSLRHPLRCVGQRGGVVGQFARPPARYRPTGKAEDHRAHAEAEQAKIGPVCRRSLQGGTFCSAGSPTM